MYVNQKVRFEFRQLSKYLTSSKRNSIFQNFQKEDKHREGYEKIEEKFSRKFFSTFATSLPEFLKFSIEWFTLGNSIVSAISGKEEVFHIAEACYGTACLWKCGN